jgi:phospholipid transport system substrate-binding protein
MEITMTSPLVSLQKWRSMLFAVLAVVVFGTAAPSFAQSMTPDALVKKVTEDVLVTVKGDADIKSGNLSKIQGLVESKILPYVNFQKMTATAVGRNWSQASPDQQKQITEQFRQLLIYTYSGALTDVSDQRVEYRPFRGDPADSVVQVDTRIVNPRGGEPVQLNYKLDREGADWKIVDVNVLGVWLVENYRNSFQQEVSRGGIDGLIKSLTAKNQQLASGTRRKG